MLQNKELRGLIMMRKTLANVIKDATPKLGDPHPLAQETLDNIKTCFAYIAIRERELSEQTGDNDNATPRFVDEIKPQKINLNSIKK